MSCEHCSKAQDEIEERGLAYYRWKNANVAIIGCEQHLIEICDALNKEQKLSTKE